jgi:serralysin
MTTFAVSDDVTYAGDPTNVDTIEFTNDIQTVATATFANTDFAADILDNVQITGSAGTNRIAVSGGSLDASHWFVANWSIEDSVAINGGSGSDTIIGSIRADTISGGGDSDTLAGGFGDDTFVYNAADEFVAGETVDGGGGTDTLRLPLNGLINFSGAGVLTSIEELVFADGSFGAVAVVLSAANLGLASGRIHAITGSSGANDEIFIFDPVVDLSGIAFSSWTAGSDVIELAGTAGDDALFGSSQNDIFDSSTGTDHWFGGAGNDRFDCGPGASAGDTIDGGAGTDALLALPFDTDLTVVSIVGVERLLFYDGFNSASVHTRGDQFGAGGFSSVEGGKFDPTVANALIVSGAAVDLSGVTFLNWTSFDTVTINGDGAAGNVLKGSSQIDTINGGDLNDVLTGGLGADVLNGGLGNDIYNLEDGNDAVTDAGGVDTVTSTISRSIASLTAIEKLTLLGTAAINGTGNVLDNTLTGNGTANMLNGLSGADTMLGGAGNDTYFVDNRLDIVSEAGGGGIDKVVSAFSFSLVASAHLVGPIEKLVLTGRENIGGTGNPLANTIIGNIGANQLKGGAGNDVLTGGNGNDRLFGEAGKDRLTGGANNDTFVFNTAPNAARNRDTITDFSHVNDTIQLDYAVFTALGGNGALKLAFFHLGTAAADADDHVIYNRATGALIYDSNGNAAGGAVQFATLINRPALQANDFLVI